MSSATNAPAEQTPDGSWHASCPEPLWVGWRLRVAQCTCGAKFRGRDARSKYREHWYGMLAAVEDRRRRFAEGAP